MDLQHFKPDIRLKDLIQGYWLLEAEQNKENGRINSFFPLGSIEIIFHLQSPLLRLQDDFYRPEKKMFIEGQQTGILKVKQEGPLKTIGATLYPWATTYFFNILPSEFTNKSFNASTIDASIDKLYNLLLSCHDTSLIPELCNSYFLSKLLSSKHTINPTDRFLIDILKQPTRSYQVQELKSNWKFSAKYFEKKCLDIMGVSAGDLLKKMRMKKALKMSLSKSFTSFTDVAYAAGYYDQSHFIKDFKFYFGASPRNVLKENDSLLHGFL